MKTILVPTDFSKHSEYALEVAASIAKKHQSTIVLLHMMGMPESFLTNDEKDEIFNAMYFIKITKKKFDEFLKKDFLKDLVITTAVKSHRVFSEINEVAAEYNADLIVMGSHGVSGFAKAFVGSNTEKVVRTANVPVLVIKKAVNIAEIKKAVLVTDFDPESKRTLFNSLTFFGIFDVKPEILYVNIPEKFMSTSEMLHKAEEFFAESKDHWMDSINYYDDYSTEIGILSYCRENMVDIIGIPTHGRKGLSHLFYGSIGENIANHSDIPVVTFKLEN